MEYSSRYHLFTIVCFKWQIHLLFKIRWVNDSERYGFVSIPLAWIHFLRLSCIGFPMPCHVLLFISKVLDVLHLAQVTYIFLISLVFDNIFIGNLPAGSPQLCFPIWGYLYLVNTVLKKFWLASLPFRLTE